MLQVRDAGPPPVGAHTSKCTPPLQAMQAKVPVSRRDVDEVMGLVDANHDGTLSWEEFLAFMRSVALTPEELHPRFSALGSG